MYVKRKLLHMLKTWNENKMVKIVIGSGSIFGEVNKLIFKLKDEHLKWKYKKWE